MSRDIRPLEPGDLAELSRFLTAGFHADVDADFAAPEVLRWKYLGGGTGEAHEAEPTGESREPLSYVALDESGRIIGHLGLCRTAFEGRALEAAGGRVETIHIIDWLGSPGARAVGMSLMRRAHQGMPTQFGLGVSPSALVVGERAGYDLRSLVPVYTRVLRPGYWLRAGGLNLPRRLLGLVRDTIGRLRPRGIGRGSVPRLQMEPVEWFGDEIAPIVRAASEHAVFTSRDPARLNDFLAFPRQNMTGWHIRDDSGALRGFALLNVIPRDRGWTRIGKVVDCLLDETEVSRWQAAFGAIARELDRQGADVVQAYASTPWAAESLRRCGFVSRYSVKFHIRDRRGLIPHGPAFYLTPLEGDYGYT
ncbi:MAG: GNAT family N-acetyltransferase [Isosphaeraceae bacterium]